MGIPLLGDCGTDHRSEKWLNLDPCGLICAVFVYGLISVGVAVAAAFVVLPWVGLASFWGVLHMSVLVGGGILAIASHVQAMVTNPGAIPRNAIPAESASKRRVCLRCQCYKPPLAHHCSICNRCIVKMDHHCPWVNNCVGQFNQKHFLLFIFYVNALSVYALVLIVIRFSTCFTSSGCTLSGMGNVVVMLLVMETMLFGLFTGCMLADQLSNVSSGITGIDRLKGREARGSSFLDNLRDTMGDAGPSVRWLLPVAPRWRDTQRLTGYQLGGTGKDEEAGMEELQAT